MPLSSKLGGNIILKFDWTKENLGYPKPEEFDAMTHEEFEALCSN